MVPDVLFISMKIYKVALLIFCSVSWTEGMCVCVCVANIRFQNERLF